MSKSKALAVSDIELDEHGNQKHPSFGMVKVSQTSSSGRRAMFGSNLLHDTFFSVSLYNGRVNRSGEYGSNLEPRYSGREMLVEFDMTASQFLSLITKQNQGEGVPVTLRYVTGDTERRPEAPMPDRPLQNFKDHVAARSEDITKAMHDLMSMVQDLRDEGRPVPKKVLGDIVSRVERLRTEIEKNMPHIVDRAHESMDGMVDEARREINEYAARSIVKASVDLGGLTTGNDTKALSDGRA